MFISILIIIIPVVIPMVFGNKYHEAIIFAQWFTIIAGLRSINYILQKFEQYDRILKGTYFISTVSPLIEIVVMAYLIPSFKLYGVILGRLVGETVNLLYLLPIFVFKDSGFNQPNKMGNGL